MDIVEYNGEGYMPLVSYDGWRVAIAAYSDNLLEENLKKVERHLETDEVFILLQGEACLHIGKELKKTPLKVGKIYNVKRGEWHCISMKKGTKVAIVENDNTGNENTEYFYF